MKTLLKQQELINQIHNEFDSAQERLLNEAQRIINETKIDEQTELENVALRLSKIGFVNTPVVSKAKEIESKRKQKEQLLVKNREQAELIQYYKRTYPFQKFLTEEELDRICKKYNLVYAPVGNYIKDVPKEKLEEIENAKQLNLSDINKGISIFKYNMTNWSLFKDEYVLNSEIKNWESKVILEGSDRDAIHLRNYLQNKYNPTKKISFGKVEIEKFDKDGLFIAAPESHFNLNSLVKKGYGFLHVIKTEVKDPIVFRYCRGGIQVLSKWGLEAEDEMLINEINN